MRARTDAILIGILAGLHISSCFVAYAAGKGLRGVQTYSCMRLKAARPLEGSLEKPSSWAAPSSWDRVVPDRQARAIGLSRQATRYLGWQAGLLSWTVELDRRAGPFELDRRAGPLRELDRRAGRDRRAGLSS